MSQAISNISNDVAQEVVPAVASVVVTGTTVGERRKSVLAQGLTEAAAMTMAGLKGKDGAMLRERIVDAGVNKAIRMACNGSYIALVEIFALKTGQSLTINNKDEFNSMPFVIEQLIVAERNKGKSNGQKVDAKTGLTVDVPKVAALMELKALLTEAVNSAQAAFIARAAKRAAVANAS